MSSDSVSPIVFGPMLFFYAQKREVIKYERRSSERKQDGRHAHRQITDLHVTAHDDLHAGTGTVQYCGQYFRVQDQRICPTCCISGIPHPESDDRCGGGNSGRYQCLLVQNPGRKGF